MKRISLLLITFLSIANFSFAQNSLSVADTRNVPTTPDSYSRSFVLNFKSADTLGLKGSGGIFVGLMGIRPWTDNSGGKAHELAFATNDLYLRSGYSPNWEKWRKILTEDVNGKVGIGTTAPTATLDVNGDANATMLYINNRRLFYLPEINPERGPFNPVWMGIRSGRKLFPDEQFKNGLNKITIYNNSGNGTVRITRDSIDNAPNSTGYCLKISHTGTAIPGIGGFLQSFNTAVNRTYIHAFRAKVPVGYLLNSTSNAIGTNGNRYWLTNNGGTGKWEDYAYVVQSGNSGTFSTAGYVYLSGTTVPSPEAPLEWWLASSTVFDATYLNDGAGSNTNADMLDSLHATDFLKNQASTDQAASFRINGDGFIGGNVGIGATDTKGYKLAVAGGMIADKVRVKVHTAWPDYVFHSNYQLPRLQDIEQYIKKHQHLPGMPDATDVKEKGLDIGEINKQLLEKIEQLTLYLIEQEKKMNALESGNTALEEQLRKIENKIANEKF